MNKGWQLFSFTSLVEILCIGFFAAQLINGQVMLSFFSLNHVQGLSTDRPWEFYRLITPAFLHFGLFHIAFNLVMWEALARPLERTVGAFKTIFLFIAVALVSNMLQYGFLSYNMVFGGLSGVVYGFIGYMGIITRRRDVPYSLQFPRGLLAVSVIFIAAGFFINGGLANMCHLGGLLTGALVALFDFRSRRLFRRASRRM